MLGQRIKQARAAAGFSQRRLAQQAGVSAMAISKYERDQLKPSSDVLLRLSQALGVRVEYFFRQTDVSLEDVDYRKHPRLPRREERRVLAEVVERLERWAELESVLPQLGPKPFALPDGLPERVESLDDVEDCAMALREGWHLGSNPIGDLVEELEQEDIRVVLVDYDAQKRFDGLLARMDGVPVIVVGRDWPGDRQRFTLAHELGHLVLEGRLPRDLAANEKERYCHRFAGAFLVPRHEAVKALGETRHWLEPQELYLLKHEWGLSMNAWLHRAQDLGIVKRRSAGKLWDLFQAHGWREHEPGEELYNAPPRRFEQLVFRALAEDFIGEARAAELLGVPLVELRARRRLDPVDAAGCH